MPEKRKRKVIDITKKRKRKVKDMPKNRKQKKEAELTKLKRPASPIKKILSAFGIAGMFLFTAFGQTNAYFSDIETSGDNKFSAGSLDISLTVTEVDELIGLSEEISFGSVLVNSGSLDWQYTVETEKISGSDPFCDALDLEVELNGVEKHDDSLTSFALATSTLPGTWAFEVKLPADASDIPNSAICEVEFVYQAWQIGMPSFESGGFTDEERINLTLTSRMIVLNEFLPNPDGVAYGFDFGDDSSDMPQGEWAELYNNSTEDYDLDGWYIWDASGFEPNKVFVTASNTVPATTTIAAKDWLVVYMNKAVFNNSGDTVKLFDGSDVLIDSHTYTDNDFCEIEPTPGDENSTTATGSCGGVPPNKSYARIPDGIGDWVDPIPTPGGANKLDTGKQEDGAASAEADEESNHEQIPSFGSGDVSGEGSSGVSLEEGEEGGSDEAITDGSEGQSEEDGANIVEEEKDDKAKLEENSELEGGEEADGEEPQSDPDEEEEEATADGGPGDAGAEQTEGTTEGSTSDEPTLNSEAGGEDEEAENPNQGQEAEETEEDPVVADGGLEENNGGDELISQGDDIPELEVLPAVELESVTAAEESGGTEEDNSQKEENSDDE